MKPDKIERQKGARPASLHLHLHLHLLLQRLPTPLSRKETLGLLLIAVAILWYLLARYSRFVDWSVW